MPRHKNGFERAKKFVVAWQEADSVEDVCRKMGISINNAYCLAHQYRRRGIKLKSMKTGNRYDWSILKKLA